MYKKLGITITIFVLSFWFWFVVKSWIAGESLFLIPSSWLKPLIMLVVFSSVIAVAFLILSRTPFWLKWMLSWITGLAYLIVFGFTLLNLAVLGAILLINIYAIKIAETEANERIKLNYGLALRRAMPTIILPLLLAISFSYFQSLNAQTPEASRQRNITIQDAIERTAAYFLGFDTVEQKVQEQNMLDEQLIDKAFNVFRDKFYFITTNYGRFIPPVLAFGLFFILWGLSGIFVYLSLGLAVFFVWILKKSGFIGIENVKVDAERIKL